MPNVTGLAVRMSHSFSGGGAGSVLGPHLSANFQLASCTVVVRSCGASGSGVGVLHGGGLNGRMHVRIVTNSEARPVFRASCVNTATRLNDRLRANCKTCFHSAPSANFMMSPAGVLGLVPGGPFGPGKGDLWCAVFTGWWRMALDLELEIALGRRGV